MNRTRPYRIHFLTIMAGAAITTGSLLIAQEPKLEPDSAMLPLVPVFSTAQDSPAFTLDYVNDTSESVNIMGLMQNMSGTLDGKVYRSKGILYVGPGSLPPGGTQSINIGPTSFLRGAEKKKYSTVLKRWRWKSPLESGKHTLLVRFGEKEYGPITFHWDGDVPFLYE